MTGSPFRFAALAIAAAFAVSSCGSSSDTDAADTSMVGAIASAQKVNAVATFYPIAWMVEQIGGDRVNVTNLTPPGVEPHDLELSPDQVETLTDADLALVMGRDFQPGPEKIAAKRSKSTITLLDIVGAGDGLVEQHEDEDGEVGHAQEEGLDPHVWLDPRMFSTARTEIVSALSEIDPTGASDFAQRADNLAAALADLDSAMETGLATCTRRTIVTAHEAFGRLATRYGLTQEGIAGLSPDAEPDPQRIADLTDLVSKQGLTTVFFEELAPQNFAETLAREAGVKTAMLSPLEAPTAAELAAGSSYLTIMRANLTALRVALDCK